MKRLGSAVFVLLGVSVVVFALQMMIPGDAATSILGLDATPEAVAQLRAELGLDKPPLQRYLDYMGGVVQGDFGNSLMTGRPVTIEILDRLPFTAQLAFVGMAIAIVVGIPMGAVAAVWSRRSPDHLVTGLSLVGVSMPIFWLGLVLIQIFAIRFGLFPSGGTDGIRSLVLPALTIAAPTIALISRVTRSSLLDVLSEDYLAAVRAKGVSFTRAVARHALPNAANPIITLVGLQFGFLMGGTVITEAVFARTGLGSLLLLAIERRDVVVVQSALLWFAAFFVLINLIVDLSYGAIDPRVRYG